MVLKPFVHLDTRRISTKEGRLLSQANRPRTGAVGWHPLIVAVTQLNKRNHLNG